MLVNVERNAFLEVRADGLPRTCFASSGGLRPFGASGPTSVGDRAFELATIFDKAVRQPLKEGAGYGRNRRARSWRSTSWARCSEARIPDEICVYSIPGEPVDAGRNFIYHQACSRMRFGPWATRPPDVESHVIIQSEFREQEYTGIGITCGGGTFNVCVPARACPP
jgi:hypothetical protein